MSVCCALLIVIIIVVALLIIFILKKLYEKLNNVLENNTNKGDELTENSTTNNQRQFIIPDIVIEDVDAAADETTVEETVNNYLTFSPLDHSPSVRLCGSETGKKCDYMDICNIYICKHMTNSTKIYTDKNTLKNVTYIHTDKCIVVFISKNENVCSKEQDMSLEDINYINAYTSKYPELSVHVVFYDKENEYFKDFRGRLHIDLRIPLADELTRDILQPSNRAHFIPSAPTETTLQPGSPHLPHNHQGNFFYIGKQ